MTRNSNKSQLVVGIDLGGTNMQIGVVDGRNRIIGHERRKTHAKRGVDAVIDRIVEGVETACSDAGVKIARISAIGIAAPGAIDIPRGVVLAAPNLKWYGVPLRTILGRRFRKPIV